MLRIHQLTKRFYSLTALNQVSFRVGEGEILGVLGPNGAGKTTLFKILAGLIQPDKGWVQTDIARWPRIGYKPERPRFPESMTIRRYLQTCVGLTELPKSQQAAAVKQVITQVGLATLVNNRISDCSKGMRQKIGLAQALLGDPQLLILDEPSDGLDPDGQQEIRNLLRQLRDEGKTIIISSHHLAEVTAVCSRLLILNHGRIVYHKTMEEALAERPQTIIEVDRSLSAIKPLLGSLHSQIVVDDNLHLLYIQEGALTLKREILSLLLAANYDILHIAHQTARLADIYHEVVRS